MTILMILDARIHTRRITPMINGSFSFPLMPLNIMATRPAPSMAAPSTTVTTTEIVISCMDTVILLVFCISSSTFCPCENRTYMDNKPFERFRAPMISSTRPTHFRVPFFLLIFFIFIYLFNLLPPAVCCLIAFLKAVLSRKCHRSLSQPLQNLHSLRR